MSDEWRASPLTHHSLLITHHSLSALAMSPERWRQITDIFEAALLRDAGARAGFLREACAGDDELRGEVEALLESHGRASRFIEEPALALAARQGGGGATLVGQTVAHYQV